MNVRFQIKNKVQEGFDKLTNTDVICNKTDGRVRCDTWTSLRAQLELFLNFRIKSRVKPQLKNQS